MLEKEISCERIDICLKALFIHVYVSLVKATPTPKEKYAPVIGLQTHDGPVIENQYLFVLRIWKKILIVLFPSGETRFYSCQRMVAKPEKQIT